MMQVRFDSEHPTHHVASVCVPRSPSLNVPRSALLMDRLYLLIIPERSPGLEICRVLH